MRINPQSTVRNYKCTNVGSERVELGWVGLGWVGLGRVRKGWVKLRKVRLG